jgi:hypothetical protein
MLAGCFAESKTYPDDGTCLRRALFSFPRRHQKKISDYIKFLFFPKSLNDSQKA